MIILLYSSRAETVPVQITVGFTKIATWHAVAAVILIYTITVRSNSNQQRDAASCLTMLCFAGPVLPAAAFLAMQDSQVLRQNDGVLHPRRGRGFQSGQHEFRRGGPPTAQEAQEA